MQTRTSKMTNVRSSNTTGERLPKAYVDFTFPKGAIVVDYGCGYKTDHLRTKVENDGAIWYGYDPYWNDDKEVLTILEKGVDIAICCNVLNVIDDVDTIKEIITKLTSRANRVIIQVWRGNGSGIGRETMEDCWQRNENLSVYKKMITDMGFILTPQKGFIVIDKDKQVRSV